MIQSQRGQGKSNIVISSKVRVGDAIRTVTELRENLQKAETKLGCKRNSTDKTSILHEAAMVPRRHMTDTDLQQDHPSPAQVSVESSQRLLPPSLIQMMAAGQEDTCIGSVLLA